MDVVTLAQPARPLSPADLDAMPDDGHRRELVAGTLVVSAAPSRRHQRVLLRLALALEEVVPPDLELLTAPFDVDLGPDTRLQPDLLVARVDDLTEANLPSAPVLAVEILSPSSRGYDLYLKRARYEAAGTPSYWVVDPLDLTLTAWELDDTGRYQQTAHLTATDTWTTTQPFPVTLTPGTLCD